LANVSDKHGGHAKKLEKRNDKPKYKN